MKYFKITVFFLSLLLISACGSSKEKDCIDESKINEDAVCTMEYDPVCGCDGKTYGNECQARNSGVLTWEKGECEENM